MITCSADYSYDETASLQESVQAKGNELYEATSDTLLMSVLTWSNTGETLCNLGRISAVLPRAPAGEHSNLRYLGQELWNAM